MIANVCVPTELLFSLVDSLRIVPLRGALTLLTLKDHPSKPGNQMAFIQYVERDVDAQKLVYLDVFASTPSCSGFCWRRKNMSCKTHVSRQNFHVLLTSASTYAEIRSDFEYKHADDNE